MPSQRPLRPDRPRTATYPKVGERRWVRGKFEVEVLGFECSWNATHELELARVWLDPERTTLDPDSPGANQNTQDPWQLLTLEEAARQMIAVARWRGAEADRLERESTAARRAQASAMRDASALVRKVTGADIDDSGIGSLACRRLEEALDAGVKPDLPEEAGRE